FEFIAEAGSAAVLPDDGGVDGVAGLAIPEQRSFSLVRDAYASDIVAAEVRLG
ncbi:MAG: hypothetical protein RI897_4357, partial [Verrucomicrobiota bacterium]